MLSKQAFNALLKTLEEPPDHALFIFATTEPHKVLPTILSRCQRFDFRRIPVPEIVDRLREICEIEGVEADEESLMLLARKGNGALRDALSAFDQAISLCGDTLAYGDLTEALGVVDQDLYFDLTDHVATQDTAGVLTLVRHVVRSGYDLQEFLAGLAEHLRNLLVARSLGGDALEGVAESTRRQYATEAERFGEADLLRLLTVAGDAEDDVKNSPQPRLKLETTLLKMAQMRRTADLREVLQKIDRLEQMVEEGDIPESLADASSTPSPDDAPASPTADEAAPEAAEPTSSYDSDSSKESTPSSQEDDPAPATDEEEAAAAPPAGSASAPAPGDGEDEPEPDDADAAPGDRADSPPPDETKDEAAGDDASSVEYDDLFGPPALGDDASSGGNGHADASGGASSTNESSTDARGGTPASGGEGGGPQAAVAEPAVESTAQSADGLAQQWPQFVEAVKDDRISLGSLLGEAEPTQLRGEVLTVTVPKPLHRDTLRGQRRFLLKHLAATFEVTIEDVEFVVEEPTSEEASTEAADEPASPREQLQALRDTYPALDVLFEDFGAEPVW